MAQTTLDATTLANVKTWLEGAYDEDTKHQQDAVLCDRAPMTLTSICQGTRCTEHLGDGYQTEH